MTKRHKRTGWVSFAGGRWHYYRFGRSLCRNGWEFLAGPLRQKPPRRCRVCAKCHRKAPSRKRGRDCVLENNNG
jgi:hypothetical protein